MPCYDPPMTSKDRQDWHEQSAIRILRKHFPYKEFMNGPAAVRILCAWCKIHTENEISKIGAIWWYEDHKKYDLRQSGLAKLSKAEREALGV